MNPTLSAIKNIQFGFGDMDEPIPEFSYALWKHRAKKTQVHGTRIALAESFGQDVGNADGVFTRTPGLLLTLVNADCFPLLFAKHDGSAIAALHVGWRGALGGIILKFKELLINEREDPADWQVAIGPGACACCYEVTDQIISDFSRAWNLSAEKISPTHRKLDLPVIIQHQLAVSGFQLTGNGSECTICSGKSENRTPAFHSFRRSGSQMPQVSAIVIHSNSSNKTQNLEKISRSREQAMMDIYPRLYDFSKDRIGVSIPNINYHIKPNPIVSIVTDRIFYHRHPDLKNRRITNISQDSKYLSEWVNIFMEQGGNVILSKQ
ncbi:YfiH family protein [Advenella incenata]|uniref:YfiH family protein n=1 Tax=Advenella incenata TaxID=267800 RepID=A0A4Q7VRA2_9BURK|nr:polyphenol oxidase family protein [Advenella incenata]RZT99023.1 YfiH family protein [Advenella incenata]